MSGAVVVTRDLRAAFGGTRDQGSRPTCCAFACSDLHAACRSPWSELSCEFAFYHAVRRQGTGPQLGVYLHHMLDVVEQDGQPVEAAWPYLPSVPADPAHWSPPPDVGRLFHAKGTQTAAGSSGGAVDPTTLRDTLNQGTPAVLVMSWSDAFQMPDGDGVIDAAEAVDPTRVHAIVAVGHGTRGQEAFTLVRNSWGSGWGRGGYAWLSDRYLAPRMIEFATLAKVD